MAGHPYLSQIADPMTRAALKAALDEIAALRTQVTALQAQALQTTRTMDAGGQRLTNVADPQSEGDAVNLRTLKRLVNATVGSF